MPDADTDVIQFTCWSCNLVLTVPTSMAGVSGPCPRCTVMLKAPEASTRPFIPTDPALVPPPAQPPAPPAFVPIPTTSALPTTLTSTGLPPGTIAPPKPGLHKSSTVLFVFAFIVVPIAWHFSVTRPRLAKEAAARVAWLDKKIAEERANNEQRAKNLALEAAVIRASSGLPPRTPSISTSKSSSQPRPVSMAKAGKPFPTGIPKFEPMLLRNFIEFTGHTPMEGASSFLGVAPDGRRWLVSVEHLLGEMGGVEPPLTATTFTRPLIHWTAHNPLDSDDLVRVPKTDLRVIHVDDGLMLSVPNDAKLPTKPIPLRPAIVRKGEYLYIVGLPYDMEDNDDSPPQVVYSGRAQTGATNRYDDTITVSIEHPPEDMAGFSGAPVVDADGQAVGVVSGVGMAGWLRVVTVSSMLSAAEK